MNRGGKLRLSGVKCLHLKFSAQNESSVEEYGNYNPAVEVPFQLISPVATCSSKSRVNTTDRDGDTREKCMAGISGRVVVGLRGHDSKEAPKIANFFTCLVHHFAGNELSTTISCVLQNDMLVLYPSTGHINNRKIQIPSNCENTVLECVQLQHSPECPFWKLQEERTSLMPHVDKKIYVGVAILVESSDAHIFMTQRSDQMRSFPKAWVPPGGTLERGETLLHCALRELQEESGLALNPDSTRAELLCLWESVYPGFLGIGEPRAHHLVFYFLAKTNETWKELQEKVKMDPEEVKACAWLSEDSVRHLCRAKRKIVQQFIFGDDGEMKPAQLDLSHMFHSAMFRDGKIYSGSQMALNLWLDHQAAVNSKM